MYILCLFEAVYISHDISLEKKGLECRNITASAAGARPVTTRIPEFVETSQQQYNHQQGHQQHNMDENNS
jgi:hypothetical protein